MGEGGVRSSPGRGEMGDVMYGRRGDHVWEMGENEFLSPCSSSGLTIETQNSISRHKSLCLLSNGLDRVML